MGESCIFVVQAYLWQAKPVGHDPETTVRRLVAKTSRSLLILNNLFTSYVYLWHDAI
jgi:hypothetical protein